MNISLNIVLVFFNIYKKRSHAGNGVSESLSRLNFNFMTMIRYVLKISSIKYWKISEVLMLKKCGLKMCFF